MNYFIKEREWKEIFKILCSIKGLHTKNEDHTRQFIEAIWYMSRSGCQWRLLPSHYGYWRSIHRRFKQWSDKGIWELLFQQIQHHPDLEATMLDATIVRAHAGAAEEDFLPKFTRWLMTLAILLNLLSLLAKDMKLLKLKFW